VLEVVADDAADPLLAAGTAAVAVLEVPGRVAALIAAKTATPTPASPVDQKVKRRPSLMPWSRLFGVGFKFSLRMFLTMAAWTSVHLQEGCEFAVSESRPVET
jgi:hypothetical protein